MTTTFVGNISTKHKNEEKTDRKTDRQCKGRPAPRAWNSLLSSLQELTDTETFKRKLKTFLFSAGLSLNLCSSIRFVFILFYFSSRYVIRWLILFCKRKSLWTMNQEEGTHIGSGMLQPRQLEEVCPCSPIVGNIQVKMDGSEKTKDSSF